MSGFKVNFSVNNQLATPSIHAAPLAQRPAFGQPGRVFIDTDAPSTGIYRDTGSAWIQIASTSSPEADTLQTVTDRGNTTTNDIAIGTSSNPSAPLDVHGQDTIAILQATGTNNGFLQFNKSGSGKFKVGNVHNAGNDYFTVYNLQENSDAILVNISTNNVAIGGGVVAPSYRLDVQGSLRSTGVTYLATGGNTVGVNTTTPISTSAVSIQKGSFTENLTLLSSTGDTRIEFRSDSGTIAGGIKLDSSGLGMGGGTSFRGAVYVSRTTNNVIINAGSDAGYKFDCYGTARVSGNVGFGGSNPDATYKLSVGGIFQFSTGSSFFGNSSGNLTLNNWGAYINNQLTSFTYLGQVNGTNTGSFTGTSTAVTLNAITNIPLRFLTNNTEVARFTESGILSIGTTTPNVNALLDIVSTTKGVKFPSMTTAQKNAIANTAGLVVFDTTLAKLCVNSGAGWETITSI